jgi:hypothetical protein
MSKKKNGKGKNRDANWILDRNRRPEEKTEEAGMEGKIDVDEIRVDEIRESSHCKRRIIYCFWTGNNVMSDSRKSCLDQLRSTSGCEVTLVTPENLQQHILPDHPLHDAYELLSETHKADYLRTYFMNFHGGGYSDIKKTTGSWTRAFDQLYSDSRFWMCGYPELPGESAWSGADWRELIGNGAYISIPGTPLTNEWYNAMIALLDRKLPELTLNPSKHPQDSKSETSNYPIYWTEMLGQIFHRVAAKYSSRLLMTLPISIFHNYR